MTKLRLGAATALAVLALGLMPGASTEAGEMQAPTPSTPNSIVPLPPPTGGGATGDAVPLALGGGIEVLALGFGQSKPGAPVTVAARLRNDGPAVDLTPVSLTVYDAGGVVIAAGDATMHYLAPGETTGFAHRLTVRGAGTAARADIQSGDGRPASDPLPGSLTFSSFALVGDRTGSQASAVLSSSYNNDLSDVRVDALAYDGRGTIIGGGEVIKRLVPSGGSVGVLVPLDLSGTPARIELYAHLP